MDALGHRSFSVVGHDTGMDIAYALSADHHGRVKRLAVAEAVLRGWPRRRRYSFPGRSTRCCSISCSTGFPR
jgi:pimeloyl-ACP methyl ester carboxylesterase